MDRPFISVIIPVYNIKEYLERCVLSVRNQTYSDLEIILVDDGSTDGTSALCDELAKEDGRIRVFHKENGGSSSARNLGIENAKGEYLGFVDSDDYVSEEMYESLVEAILEHHAKIAQVGRDEIDAEGNMLPNICEPPAEKEFISSKDFFRELLMHRGDCSFCTKLVAADLFRERKFPQGELNEDFKLLIQMLQETAGVVSLPGQYYHVFYRIGSNTRKIDKDDFSRVYGDNVDNADLAKNLVQTMEGLNEEERLDLGKAAIRFGLFQRLDYLLHVPVSKMEKDNKQYKEIVTFVRRNLWQAVTNPYLTMKNKIYLALFALFPKGIRVVHSHLKRG